MSQFSVMGQKMTIGIHQEWATARIENIPPGGKVIRRRFRHKQIGVAFVKCGHEIRKYYLAITEHGLKLFGLAAINRKEPT